MKRIAMSITALCLVMVLLASCVPGKESEVETSTEAPAPAGGEYVVKDVDLTNYTKKTDDNRVFYEIFVGSFSDSNGDGIGDLRGIINRMDYLNDGDPASGKSLGIEGIWLTPIFESPSYHKYDTTDYYQIDDDFGTMDDLKELIDLCHERNVKVILDLVINHTGSLNKWFREFGKAQRDLDDTNPYFDYFSYYRKPDGSPEAGHSYSQLSGTDVYYECNFSGDMPEPNYDNELVRQNALDIAKYYIDLGVDGFRFDAAKYIYYGDNAKSAEFWNWYVGELKKMKPDIYTVAEVWDGDSITEKYFPAVDCFDFAISQASGLITSTARAGDVAVYTNYVSKYLSKIESLREGATFTPFITNHDMDRAAGFLTEASGQMKIAANIYILGPGSPFIYYGEEIGMRGSRGSDSTDANRRLAMLWGDEDTVKNPKGSTYSSKYQTDRTVALQVEDSYSLYTYYKKLLMIRAANPEIASGTYQPVTLSPSAVGGFISTLNGSSCLVIHNTGLSSQKVDLSTISGISVSTLAAVIGVEEASLDGTTLTIGGQTSVVLR